MKRTGKSSRTQGQSSRGDKELMGAELPRSLMPHPGNRFAYKQLVGPSYKVDLISDVININVASGSIASVTSVGNLPALIRDWVNKWAVTFEEYRLLGLRAIVKNVASSATGGVEPGGVAAVWFDEQSGGSPSSANARSERHAELSLSKNVSSVTDQTVIELSWTPHDIADMAFIDTSAGTPNPLFLKVYTDPTYFGAIGTQSTRIQIEVAYRVLFRGLV